MTGITRRLPGPLRTASLAQVGLSARFNSVGDGSLGNNGRPASSVGWLVFENHLIYIACKAL